MNLFKWVRATFAPAQPTHQPPAAPVRAPQVDATSQTDGAPLRSMATSAVSSVRRANLMEEVDADAVARWMAATLDRHGFLYQEVAVLEVVELFGARFTHLNAAGNRVINRDVLQAFNALIGKSAGWEVASRAWRKRAEGCVAHPEQSAA